MKHLNKQQLEQLKTQLEAKLTPLKQFQTSIDETNPIHDESRLVGNAEAGDEALEDDQILQSEVLSEESRLMIAEVKAALQRIEAGNYGLDEVTGQPIPFERLRLVPEARTATVSSKT